MAGPEPITPAHEARIRERLNDPASTFTWGDMAAVIERVDWLQGVERRLQEDRDHWKGHSNEYRYGFKSMMLSCAEERTRAENAERERDEARGQVERVQALFAGGPDTPCRTVWAETPWGMTECVEVPMADLREVLAVPDQPTTEAQTWVCDGCMRTVTRSQIADMADGEHVLCKACRTAAAV